jgi:hypothetical protein
MLPLLRRGYGGTIRGKIIAWTVIRMMFKGETGRKRTGGLAIMLRSCGSSNSTSARLLKYQNRHHHSQAASALELAQVFQSGSDPMIPGQRGKAGSNQIPFSRVTDSNLPHLAQSRPKALHQLLLDYRELLILDSPGWLFFVFPN